MERRRDAEGEAPLPPVIAWLGLVLIALVGGLSMIFGKAKGWSRERAAEADGGMSEVVGYLREHLGPEVTAYLSGAERPEVVERWADARRLRPAFEAARYVVEAYGDETARTWFFNRSPSLNDAAPAYVLRHGAGPDQWNGVVPAAMEFVETAR